MKNLYNNLGKTVLFLMLLTGGFLNVKADENTDNEGMPIVYLKGEMTGWMADEAYRFTRNGLRYTLEITEKNALDNVQFKIATPNWAIVDFGDDITLTSEASTLTLIRGGQNIKSGAFHTGTIMFDYSEGNNLDVTFIPTGADVPVFPDKPDLDGNHDWEGMPIVYLKGQMTSWDISPSYRFNRTGTRYTLLVDDKIALNNVEFKIASADWKTVNYGDNITLPSEPANVTLINDGDNIKSGGFHTGTIVFNYDGQETVEVTFMPGVLDPDLTPVVRNPWSGTLPVMYINVYKDESHTSYDNSVIDYNLDHKDYFNEAVYWLDTNGCEWMEELGAASVGSEEKPLPLQIKARGNWTRRGFSKKPFKIKLDKKQDLLGLTEAKSKHYALLAHADDNAGFLRNFTAFNLGKRIGLPWTPGMQPVELVINGNYRGLYFLTESVRVGDGRIPIKELNDNEETQELISGGYVVELDNYEEDNQIRMDEKTCVPHYTDQLRITWDTPEVYSAIQKRFITDQFNAINENIGRNSDETWSYLDLDDAARYYLVNEIVSHTESYHGSTYLFRDRGDNQKWHFSPLWDAGNAFNGYTDDFFYECDPFGNTWIPSLRANKKFNDKVKETWLWFMQNEYPGIEDDMEEYVERIKTAATYDYKRWGNEQVPFGGQQVADNRDMSGRLNYVKDHLRSKVNWLKGIFGDYTKGNYSEPERDTTLAAELPEYASTGIFELPADSEENFNGETEYYNLQGIRISNPRRGEIYIMRQGGQSCKVILR